MADHRFSEERTEQAVAVRGLSGANQANKRNRRNDYVSQACLNCRKRKVKCTGGIVCVECRKSQETCKYTEVRRRKRTERMPSEGHRLRPRDSVLIHGSSENDAEMPSEISTHMMDMTTRLSHLERHYSKLRTAIAGNTPDNPNFSAKHVSIPNEASPIHLQGGSNSPIEPELGDGSSILSPIVSLDRAARQETGLPATSTLNTSNIRDNPSFLLPTSFNRKETDISNAENAVRVNNGADFRPSFEVFFQHLNPLHPLLNENKFRADFDDFVFNGGASMNDFDRHQFLALIYLVQCEMNYQQGSCADQNKLLGWQEFRTAEAVLGHATWLGQGNLLTIQCLLIKARYLLYHEKYNSAYDTMALTVRLCFQTGLNNQPGWSVLGLDEFAITMRQRLFWCVFQLERAVALNCGLPYLMRSTDLNVDLPRPLDDRGLFPNRPLPGETPKCSAVPYLVCAVQWAYLCGEIWDAIFSASAKKPISDQLVASLDTSILRVVNKLPPQLQYQPPSLHKGSSERTQTYIRRQSVVFHLRMNSLRLLIRQEVMLSLKFPTNMAEEILQIATDSIDVVHGLLPFSYDQSARWFSTNFLTGAIMTLSCIIIKVDSSQDVCAEATISFKRAVALLESISSGFVLASRMIHRFQAILNIVNKAVVLRRPESVPFPETTYQEFGSADQRCIDILEGFSNIANVDAANLQLSQYLASHMPTPAMGDPGFWGSWQDLEWMPTV